MDNKTHLSLVIPAYNEEKRIGKSLEKALEYLSTRDYSWEIIVADDGSKDGTIDLVRSYGEKIRIEALGKNQGKGAAVRRGMLTATGKYRIFTDADFSTPVKECEKLLEKMQAGSDICIGSRAMDPAMIKEHQPFYREFMGKTFNKFVSTMFFGGIKDTQCGFKGFSDTATEAVFSRAKIDGFSFDVEALYLAKLLKLKVDQVPVEWYNDTASKVNPVSDSIKMFLELLKIKKIHGTFKSE